MSSQLKEVTELKEVSSLETANFNTPRIRRGIEAKKTVLSIILDALKQEQDSDKYAALMDFYGVLLSEVTDDELAFEILRLVQRKQGNKTEAVIELRMMNDGMETEKSVLSNLDERNKI